MGLYLYFSPDLPDVTKINNIELQIPLKVYSADGKLISQYGEKRRIPLTVEQIPQDMRNAFLAIEDSRFYQHPGIDPIGIVRAAINLIVTGKRSQGASTITQQVARNYFLTPERTFVRKIREVFLALKIEQVLSKDQILLLYLNKIPLGHRSFGVGAAAQVYYGKEVQDLTLAQIAVIAGLPKAPSTLNPIRSPKRSKARRHLVLGRMLDLQFITQQQYDEADNAPTTGKRHGAQIELHAPYLGEMVRAHMVAKYGREVAYSKGFHVYTTVPSHLQLAAQRAVNINITNYDKRHGYRGPEQQWWGKAPKQSSAFLAINDTLPTNPLTTDQIIEQLSKIKRIKKLTPAIVTHLTEQEFTALLASGESVTVKWQEMKWARAFIDDDHQGQAPKLASDIVSLGSLVRVEPQGDLWLLGQLPQVSSAFISLRPIDGAMKAIVGGYDFATSQYNRVTQAKRQIGSNIKPFIYSYALTQGYTLASIINDVPITQWDKSQGLAWRPKNSPAIYNGPTRLRLGLAQSKNVMSVKLIQKVGVRGSIDHIAKFGFAKKDLPYAQSLALGVASVTPLSVARAYATFANGGYLITPYYIDHITDRSGLTLFRATPKVACDECQNALAKSESLANDLGNNDVLQPFSSQVTEFDMHEKCFLPKERLAPRIISPHNAFLVSEMLRSVILGGGDWSKGTGWVGTSWRIRNTIKRKDMGGKTGTTNSSKDTWFTGVTPNLVATSWVGFDNASRDLGRVYTNKNFGKKQIKGRASGAKTALPAWVYFMNIALEEHPEARISLPRGIKTVRIDRATGLLTPKIDHTSLFEYFIAGTEPKKQIELPDELSNDNANQEIDSQFEDDIF